MSTPCRSHQLLLFTTFCTSSESSVIRASSGFHACSGAPPGVPSPSPGAGPGSQPSATVSVLLLPSGGSPIPLSRGTLLTSPLTCRPLGLPGSPSSSGISLLSREVSPPGDQPQPPEPPRAGSRLLLPPKDTGRAGMEKKKSKKTIQGGRSQLRQPESPPTSQHRDSRAPYSHHPRLGARPGHARAARPRSPGQPRLGEGRSREDWEEGECR